MHKVTLIGKDGASITYHEIESIQIEDDKEEVSEHKVEHNEWEGKTRYTLVMDKYDVDRLECTSQDNIPTVNSEEDLRILDYYELREDTKVFVECPDGEYYFSKHYNNGLVADVLNEKNVYLCKNSDRVYFDTLENAAPDTEILKKIPNYELKKYSLQEVNCYTKGCFITGDDDNVALGVSESKEFRNYHCDDFISEEPDLFVLDPYGPYYMGSISSNMVIDVNGDIVDNEADKINLCDATEQYKYLSTLENRKTVKVFDL